RPGQGGGKVFLGRHLRQAQRPHRREAVGQRGQRRPQRQQGGVGGRQGEEGRRTKDKGRSRPLSLVLCSSSFVLWPARPRAIREDVPGQLRRRGQVAVGRQHPVDVVEDRPDLRLAVDRLEPHRPAVEEQERHVQQRARAQAAAHRQLHPLAYLAPLVFLFI